ncbi:hypothetical protein HYT55_01495 [Candidatus Woesearchaeota archaeon]|nr:hypothetical protein [Candidatus Woesearchaeota archaeon]
MTKDHYIVPPEKQEEFSNWRIKSTIREYLVKGAIVFTGYTAFDFLSQKEWSKGTLTGLALFVFVDMWKTHQTIKREELEEMISLNNRDNN